MRATQLFLTSVIVTPNRAQYFEYEHFVVSCQTLDSGEWTVWRYTTDGLKLSQCGSGWGIWTSSACTLNTVKPSTSGVYWCQSEQRESSNTVNITVTEKSVILQSPVLPVMEGHDVTLHCQTKTPPSNLPAAFYKDGSLITTEPTGHMTIHHVTRSDEGAYKCRSEGVESPPSWLLMKEDSVPVSVTASPDTSQWYEYEKLALRCNANSSLHGWTIKRFQTYGGKLSSCGEEWGNPNPSDCSIQTAKQSDSAVYWCESPSKQRSNSINITIYSSSTPVILLVPLGPVIEGRSVTLWCKAKTPPSKPSVAFYKDGSLIRTEPTGHMTIHQVNKSHEGLYRCEFSGHGESPSSWLFVKANESSSSAHHQSLPAVYVAVLRHILVCCPYFICTLLMLSVYRQNPSDSAGRISPIPMTTLPHNKDDDELDPQYDDVIAGVTTEHRF